MGWFGEQPPPDLVDGGVPGDAGELKSDLRPFREFRAAELEFLHAGVLRFPGSVFPGGQFRVQWFRAFHEKQPDGLLPGGQRGVDRLEGEFHAGDQ